MKAFQYKGGKITIPGAYVGVDIAHYHSGELCDGPSISSTGLRQILESPAHYWAFSRLNPDRLEKPFDERKFKIGKAAHTAVLEPEKFSSQFAVSSFSDFRSKAAQQERDELEAQGIIVLNPTEAEDIEAMVRALKADTAAMALLRDGLPEVTLAFKDDVTGFWVLSRPDWLPAHPERAPVDFKTTKCASPEDWSRDMYSYGYDVQAAIGREAIRKLFGQERESFWFLLQEAPPPHVVQIAQMTEPQLVFGALKMRKALDRFAQCLETMRWPAYRGEPWQVETPPWIAKLMDLEAV